MKTHKRSYVKVGTLKSLADQFRPKERDREYYTEVEPLGYGLRLLKTRSHGKARRSRTGILKRRYSL